MAIEDRNRYIGFDPVKWLERLRYVNETSQFPPAARVLIEAKLHELQSEIRAMQDDPLSAYHD